MHCRPEGGSGCLLRRSARGLEVTPKKAPLAWTVRNDDPPPATVVQGDLWARRSRHDIWRNNCPWNPPGGAVDWDTAARGGNFIGWDNYINIWGEELKHNPVSPSTLNAFMNGEQRYKDDWYLAPGVIKTNGSWKGFDPYSLEVDMGRICQDWISKNKFKDKEGKLIADYRLQDRFSFFYNVYGIDKRGNVREEDHGTLKVEARIPDKPPNPKFKMTVSGPASWITKKVSKKPTYTFVIEQTNTAKTAPARVVIDGVDWNVMGKKFTNRSLKQKKTDLVWLHPTVQGSPTSVWAKATVRCHLVWDVEYVAWIVKIGGVPNENIVVKVTETLKVDPINVDASMPVRVFDTEITEF